MNHFFAKIRDIAQRSSCPQTAMDLGILAGVLSASGCRGDDLQMKCDALIRIAEQLPIADDDAADLETDLDDAMDEEEDRDSEKS